jgi:hypothetical protein
MIGAGAVVTHDVPPLAIGYRQSCPHRGLRRSFRHRTRDCHRRTSTGRRNHVCTASPCISSPRWNDLRGNLTLVRSAGRWPFEVKRYFLVYGVV